ncbi:MAG: CRISPR-associated protein Cas5 [Terrimicrobiaceae bacterium]|nr:CRISPR-associated protein Cas5 [Terrimicrobiaceae bacterium]
MMNPYRVEFEISGPAAMFTRPDTGAAPISYPVPTWSACKAMFESVARGFFARGGQPAAFFSATEIEIWKPVRFEKYVTNYRGPLRDPELLKKNASYQLPATILVDVCFRVRGQCVRVPGAPDESNNAPHALQEMFNRRLAKGKSKYAPCLGWKEFVPDYFGPLRDHGEGAGGFELQRGYYAELPALLMSAWDAPTSGNYRPVFRSIEVREGVLHFPEVNVRNGKLEFANGGHS